MNKFRTHNCGELRKANVGDKVKIAGWIQTTRDLGGLVFIDVRDQHRYYTSSHIRNWKRSR